MRYDRFDYHPWKGAINVPYRRAHRVKHETVDGVAWSLFIGLLLAGAVVAVVMG